MPKWYGRDCAINQIAFSPSSVLFNDTQRIHEPEKNEEFVREPECIFIQISSVLGVFVFLLAFILWFGLSIPSFFHSTFSSVILNVGRCGCFPTMEYYMFQTDVYVIFTGQMKNSIWRMARNHQQQKQQQPQQKNIIIVSEQTGHKKPERTKQKYFFGCVLLSYFPTYKTVGERREYKILNTDEKRDTNRIFKDISFLISRKQL